ARVLSWWHVEGNTPTLDVQMTLEIHHGRIFEVPVWVPPGWEVEQVTCSDPADRLRNWGPRPALEKRPGSLLLIELQPPFEGSTDTPPMLTLRLRGASR